jgi:hypothetical protein
MGRRTRNSGQRVEAERGPLIGAPKMTRSTRADMTLSQLNGVPDIGCIGAAGEVLTSALQATSVRSTYDYRRLR